MKFKLQLLLKPTESLFIFAGVPQLIDDKARASSGYLPRRGKRMHCQEVEKDVLGKHELNTWIQPYLHE